MKVVLFCGGQGLRIRDLSGDTPKPMVPVGGCPLLLHLMRYYAHYGHKEFILCLGYRGQSIKEYFLNYREALLQDFVLVNGSAVQLLKGEMEDWRITFVDTGMRSNIGERLQAVEPYVRNDEFFLANYADGLSDVPLPLLINNLQQAGKVASFVAVKPNHSFHLVSFAGDDKVSGIVPLAESDTWINGGYFVFRNDIFEYMEQGDELVEQPFQRLIARDQLMAHRYRGFWASMDTLKDHQNLEAMCEGGTPPWAVGDLRPSLAQVQVALEWRREAVMAPAMSAIGA